MKKEYKQLAVRLSITIIITIFMFIFVFYFFDKATYYNSQYILTNLEIHNTASKIFKAEAFMVFGLGIIIASFYNLLLDIFYKVQKNNRKSLLLELIIYNIIFLVYMVILYILVIFTEIAKDYSIFFIIILYIFVALETINAKRKIRNNSKKNENKNN